MSITYDQKNQLPGPLKHLCTSVTLICGRVYCPLLIHLLSSIHPTTKSQDDPSVPLFLRPCAPSPPSGCFLFQNTLRDKPPAAMMVAKQITVQVATQRTVNAPLPTAIQG
ncbi:hypothetical protein F7725_017278 [Dissostichus mawsoni]|uniref:Uncharacterized protein n=1 Tax=Dissostichus mawsoni TaxID=36200 RepID=A0A7J5Z3Y6_DISMA|nr:hypothetical protein F7725_017278 [Dissostichus mawsoni]